MSDGANGVRHNHGGRFYLDNCLKGSIFIGCEGVNHSFIGHKLLPHVFFLHESAVLFWR